jgi:hypothetical protein
MMEAAGAFETSVSYQTAWRNIPEDGHLHVNCNLNLKYSDLHTCRETDREMQVHACMFTISPKLIFYKSGFITVFAVFLESVSFFGDNLESSLCNCSFFLYGQCGGFLLCP